MTESKSTLPAGISPVLPQWASLEADDEDMKDLVITRTSNGLFRVTYTKTQYEKAVAMVNDEIEQVKRENERREKCGEQPIEDRLSGDTTAKVNGKLCELALSAILRCSNIPRFTFNKTSLYWQSIPNLTDYTDFELIRNGQAPISINVKAREKSKYLATLNIGFTKRPKIEYEAIVSAIRNGNPPMIKDLVNHVSDIYVLTRIDRDSMTVFIHGCVESKDIKLTLDNVWQHSKKYPKGDDYVEISKKESYFKTPDEMLALFGDKLGVKVEVDFDKFRRHEHADFDYFKTYIQSVD